MAHPSIIDATITIDSVDVTSLVIPRSLLITSIITAQIDTCDLRLRNAGSAVVNKWDEIIVLDGATKIFGGYIIFTDKNEGIDAEMEVNLNASDYAAYLDHIIVVAEYSQTTDKAIVQDLFLDHLAGLGYTATTFFTEENSHSRVRFNRKTLRQCIEMLASYAGAEWYIDYEKRLHFFTGVEAKSSFSISDAPNLVSTFPLFDLVETGDGGNLVNRVEVVGGDLLSENATFFMAGTGQDSRVQIPFKMSAPIGETAVQVWRNDGTELVPVWTSLTVKVGYLDTLESTSEVLHYYQEKVLETLNDLPELPNAVKIHGRYAIPIRVRVPDLDSYAFHDDLWFDEKIVDADIVDKPTARLRAKTMLAAKAYERISLKFKLNQSGLSAGETLPIKNTLHDFGQDAFTLVTIAGDTLVTIAGSTLTTIELFDEFTIQSVRARIAIAGNVEYEVSCGSFRPGLLDLLLQNHRAITPDPLWDDTERLDYLLEHDEALALAEGTPSLAATGLTYYYSNTPATAFVFGKGAFRT